MLSPGIETNLQKFSRSLNSKIPLRHHWEYVDAKKINCVIQAEMNQALQNFRNTVLIKIDGPEKPEYAEKFRSEVGKLGQEHQRKNQDLQNQAHFLLKKRREDLCDAFKFRTETQLVIEPNMDLKSLKKFIETGKDIATSYFVYHSNFRNVGLCYNEEQMKEQVLLEQELERLENVITKEQRRHLKTVLNKEVDDLLDKLETTVLKMCEKVKADSQQWNLTKRKLKGKVQEIHNFLAQNGCILADRNNRVIYSELLEIEAGENLSAQEFIEWTEGLKKEVKFEIDYEMETSDLHTEQIEDVTQVQGNTEFKLIRQDTIKEEVVVLENDSSDLEIHQEMDIDIKIEIGNLVFQKSSIKSDLAVKQTQKEGIEKRSAEEVTKSNRQTVNQTNERHPAFTSALNELADLECHNHNNDSSSQDDGKTAKSTDHAGKRSTGLRSKMQQNEFLLNKKKASEAKSDAQLDSETAEFDEVCDIKMTRLREILRHREEERNRRKGDLKQNGATSKHIKSIKQLKRLRNQEWERRREKKIRREQQWHISEKLRLRRAEERRRREWDQRQIEWDLHPERFVAYLQDLKNKIQAP